MDATQRALCRSLRQLMAKYPTVESAREARRHTDQSKPSVPQKTSHEMAQKGA